MKKHLAILLVLLVFKLTAQSQPSESLPADRPGQTMNATTLQAGLWQIQTGIDQSDYTKKSNYQGYASWAFPTDLRFGITKRLEIMASIRPELAAQDGAYAGIEYSLVDYAGYLRFNIFDGKPFGSFALLGGYKYRSYDGGIANAKIGIAKMLYRLPLGKRFQVASNLGYSFNNETGFDETSQTSGSFDYTASFAYNINPKFGLYVETYGSQSTTSTSFFDGGIFYLPNNNLQLDFIYTSGGNSNYQVYYLSFGICYRFGQAR